MKIQNNLKVNKIQKIKEATNKKVKKCPMCGYVLEENRIICSACEFDARN